MGAVAACPMILATSFGTEVTRQRTPEHPGAYVNPLSPGAGRWLSRMGKSRLFQLALLGTRVKRLRKELPIRLKQEPLLEAVFEIRFSATAPASELLPGLLYGALGGLGGGLKVERLPASELPGHIRKADPNLRFAPLVRVRWGNFVLLISDETLAVACQPPYPGWGGFRPAIMKVVGAAVESGVIASVTRYSLKYVDLIRAGSNEAQVLAFDWAIRLGERSVRNEAVALRVEFREARYVHVVNVHTAAQAKVGDSPAEKGAVIEVDSIVPLGMLSASAFLEALEKELDELHMENKAMFFGCLTDATVIALEPEYE